jgi:hypothetical protein
LAQAATGLRLLQASPEQGGELVSRMRSAGRQRKERQQSLSLPRRQRERRRVAEACVKSAEQSEVQTSHGVSVSRTIARPAQRGHAAFDAIFDAGVYESRTRPR